VLTGLSHVKSAVSMSAARWLTWRRETDNCAHGQA
jgi:hypothetical protein